MKRFASLVVAAALSTPFGSPCATVTNKHPIGLLEEKVIIVWDSQTQTQHFVRTAKFKGEDEDFGFIVPTPSVPVLADLTDAAFTRIEKLIAPPLRGGGGFGGGLEFGKVDVIGQQQVGDYKATILRAKDGGAMLKWLSANGFTSRPALEQWLDHYARNDWVFTAFKYDRPKDSKESKTSALRLSFKTFQPIYPYFEPADAYHPVASQPMAIYFVAEGYAKGQFFNGAPWKAENVDRRRLGDEFMMELARDLKLEPREFPTRPYLSVLKHFRVAGAGMPDVAFGIEVPWPGDRERIVLPGTAR